MQVPRQSLDVWFVHSPEVRQSLTSGIVRFQICGPKGSVQTFQIVYLPRIDAAAETPRTDSADPISLRGYETILLVEDNETVREHTYDILSEAGYNVLIAKDVMDAQRLCSTHQQRIHMMLSDVVMPKMKGPDLAKYCLSIRPDMKVLFVSGYTTASVTDHGIFESGAAFLQKPFAADALLSKVREVLTSN